MAKKTDKKEAVVEKAAVVEAPKGKKLVSSRGKSWYEDVE